MARTPANPIQKPWTKPHALRWRTPIARAWKTDPTSRPWMCLFIRLLKPIRRDVGIRLGRDQMGVAQ